MVRILGGRGIAVTEGGEACPTVSRQRAVSGPRCVPHNLPFHRAGHVSLLSSSLQLPRCQNVPPAASRVLARVSNPCFAEGFTVRYPTSEAHPETFSR
jgi:hypothetical protein